MGWGEEGSFIKTGEHSQQDPFPAGNLQKPSEAESRNQDTKTRQTLGATISRLETLDRTKKRKKKTTLSNNIKIF